MTAAEDVKTPAKQCRIQQKITQYDAYNFNSMLEDARYHDFSPGDPQKSVKMLVELNFVLRPKSQSFKSTHFPLSLSNVNRMFSGFKSVCFNN